MFCLLIGACHSGFATKFRLQGRSGHHDDGMQGGVLFDHSPAAPIVRVVPTVTAVTPAVAAPGATVTVTGTGFADVLASNVVVLPGGRGCEVTRVDRHSLRCVVGALGSAPLPTASAAASAADAVSGFQLALVPASNPTHGAATNTTAGCEVSGGGAAAFATTRDCIAAARPGAREIVTVANEMLWPVLHPLRAATDGAFRQEAFVAHGAAILRLPPAAMAVDPADHGSASTLRLDCGRLDRRNLCMARITTWSASDGGDGGGDGSAVVRSELLGVLCRDLPELTLPGTAGAHSYRVELVISHIEHGEQIELAIRWPGHAYVPVPSEWFWHHAGPGGPTLAHDADAHVRVTVNDVASVCRTAGGHERHHVRCGLEVSGAPQPTTTATDDIGAGTAAHRRLVQPTALSALRPPPVKKIAAPVGRARRMVEIGEGDLLWSDLVAVRQGDVPLIVPAGQTWWLDADMVAAGGVIVYGRLNWHTDTAGLTLSAEYVLVEGAGQFHIGSDASPMLHAVTIYIRNSTDDHPQLGRRFIGGYKGLSAGFSGLNASDFHNLVATERGDNDYPVISFHGKPMARTWTTLSADAVVSATELQLTHDPAAMGWAVGDEIAVTSTRIATTANGRRGHRTSIAALGPGSAVQLAEPVPTTTQGGVHHDGERFELTADVMNLARTITITGDPGDFYSAARQGLHTIMFGGLLVMDHVRAEHCGQRHTLGRYCMHMHLIGHCPDCRVTSNAIVAGEGKGITIHGTHDALVDNNVLWNVRGVGIYIEDGNEINNTISRNVMSGTTSDHLISPSDLHQNTGIYILSLTNHFLYNHISQYYLTLFTPSSGTGQGAAWGRVCSAHARLSTFRGNVDYAGPRFGLYFDNNTPRKLQRNPDGYLERQSSCDATNARGQDNGAACVVEDHVSWDNLFVGSYFLGDIQYKNLLSMDNNNGLYWKGSKNFADGDMPHVLDSTFLVTGTGGGNAALGPSGTFTFVAENVRMLGGQSGFHSGQHCGLASHNGGRHGALCAAQYVYKNVSFAGVTNAVKRYFYYGASGGNPVIPTVSVLDSDGSLGLVARGGGGGGGGGTPTPSPMGGGGGDGSPPFPSGPWELVQADPFPWVASDAAGCQAAGCTGGWPHGCSADVGGTIADGGHCQLGGSGCSYGSSSPMAGYCCYARHTACGAQTVTFPANTALQYIKLDMAGEGQYGSSLYEVKAFDGTGAQVAIVSAAGSHEDGWLVAANVHDGDPNSRWSGNMGSSSHDYDADPGWLVLGLADEAIISKLELYWEAAHPTSFLVSHGSNSASTAAPSIAPSSGPSDLPSTSPTASPNTDAVSTTVVSQYLDGFAALPGCERLGEGHQYGIACPFSVRRLAIWSDADLGHLRVTGPGFDGQSRDDTSPRFGQNAGWMPYDNLKKGYAIPLKSGATYHLTTPSADVTMFFSDPLFGPNGMFPRHADVVTLVINGATPCTLSSQDCTLYQTSGSAMTHRSGYGGCAERLYELQQQEDPPLSVATVAVSSTSNITTPATAVIDGLVNNNAKWQASSTDASPQLEVFLGASSALSRVDVFWAPLHWGAPFLSTSYSGPVPTEHTFELFGRLRSTDGWTLLANGSATPEVLYVGHSSVDVRTIVNGARTDTLQQLRLVTSAAVGVVEIRFRGVLSRPGTWAALPLKLEDEGVAVGSISMGDGLGGELVCLDHCDSIAGCNAIVVCGSQCYLKDQCVTADTSTVDHYCRTMYKAPDDPSTCPPPPPAPPTPATAWPTEDTSALGTLVPSTGSYPPGAWIGVHGAAVAFEVPKSWGCQAAGCTGGWPHGCSADVGGTIADGGHCQLGGSGCSYGSSSPMAGYCCYARHTACGAQTVTFPANTALQYIKLDMAGEGQYGSSLYEVKAFDGTGAQVAIVSAAGSHEDGWLVAANVHDGDPNSRWSGNMGSSSHDYDADPGWLVLGLADEAIISKLELYWEAAHPETFTVLSGSDADNGAPTLAEYMASAAVVGEYSIALQPVAVRTARVLWQPCSQCADNYSVSVKTAAGGAFGWLMDGTAPEGGGHQTIDFAVADNAPPITPAPTIDAPDTCPPVSWTCDWPPAEATPCCSQWGYAGTSAAHCGSDGGGGFDSRVSTGTGAIGACYCRTIDGVWSCPPFVVDAGTPENCTGDPVVDAVLSRANFAAITQLTGSSIYTWDGFCIAMRKVADIGVGSYSGKSLVFFLGAGVGEQASSTDGILARNQALVGISSFMSQCMWESGGDSPWTACDENNFQGSVTAACTQREDGQLYHSLTSDISCAVDSSMTMTAETYASWTPGPLTCAPGTATAGCCWWGRGAIQTTGPHNYAVLQRDVISNMDGFRVGDAAATDLCTNPEAMCQHDELKWVGALHYWTTVVQADGCFASTLQAYSEALGATAPAAVAGCYEFSKGTGGAINNGNWNSHAHGETGRMRYFDQIMVRS